MDCYIRYGSSLQVSSHFSSLGARIVATKENWKCVGMCCLWEISIGAIMKENCPCQ